MVSGMLVTGHRALVAQVYPWRVWKTSVDRPTLFVVESTFLQARLIVNQLVATDPGSSTTPSRRCAVLMTCHNRRSKTLSCLQTLFEARSAAGVALSMSVYLVDDGSTDGTAQAVASTYPQVTIIEGDGTLYWCGGMRLAWQEAACSGPHDDYLWLNDDVRLDESALRVLYETQSKLFEATRKRGVVVGSTRGEGGDGTSYGSLTSRGVAPAADGPRAITYFNGNIVLVADETFRTIGNLSRAYTHGFGDLDYGIRARRKGVPVWLAPGHLGECDANMTPRWRRAGLSTWQRLRELHRPTGCPPWELACLMWNDGAWWAPWTIIKLYASVLTHRDPAGAGTVTVHSGEPR